MTQRNFFISIFFILGFVLMPYTASAACYCACVNNAKTKICQNSYDANYVYCDGTYCSASLDLDKDEKKQLASLDLNDLYRSISSINTKSCSV